MNRASLSRFAACRTRSSPCDTLLQALCPEPVVLAVFSLVSPPPFGVRHTFNSLSRPLRGCGRQLPRARASRALRERAPVFTKIDFR